MADNMQALHSFWSGFGLTAYDENSVPDDAMARNGGKYLTYAAASGYVGNAVYLSASLWYKSTSWAEITQKANEIGRSIGYGGRIIPFDDGKLWIVRGNPFSQRMADENRDIRRIVLNIAAEFLAAE